MGRRGLTRRGGGGTRRHRLKTLLARSIKRCLKKKTRTKLKNHNHCPHWLFGWSLMEAHFLMNMKCTFESTNTTLISACKSSANSDPNKSPGIHILGTLHLPGQKSIETCEFLFHLHWHSWSRFHLDPQIRNAIFNPLFHSGGLYDCVHRWTFMVSSCGTVFKVTVSSIIYIF